MTYKLTPWGKIRGILMNATASGTKWSHVFSIIGFKCTNRKYGVSMCMRLQMSKGQRKAATHRLFGWVDLTTTTTTTTKQQQNNNSNNNNKTTTVTTTNSRNVNFNNNNLTLIY